MEGKRLVLYLSMAALWLTMVLAFWVWDSSGNAPPQIVHMIWFAAFLAGYNFLRFAILYWPRRTGVDIDLPPAPRVQSDEFTGDPKQKPR